MSRYIVEPFPLPSVHLRHHESMFGTLSTTIDRRLREFEQASSRSPSGFLDFLHYLKKVVAPDEFAELQRKWLRPGLLGSDEPMLKFFDLVFWAEGKFRIANRLKLRNEKPLRIVDIGAGPSHFGLVAQSLG